MASRRVRIKGIANIPQRRKNNPEKENDNVKDNTATTQSDNTPSETLSPQPETQTTPEPQHQNIQQPETPTPQIIETPKETSIETPKETIIETPKETPIDISKETTNETSKESIETPKETIIEAPEQNKISVPDVANNTQSKSLPDVKKVTRRRFIKPMVSVNAIRNKAKVEEEKQVENVEPKGDGAEEVNISLNETVLPVCNGTKVEPLTVQTNKVIGISKLPKPQYLDGTKSGSDTEYPPPPSSPSKFNRTRIKAVPRLGQRRTSFNIGSASESEDESRRTNNSRIRNDSVCSAASEVSQHSAVLEGSSQKKEFSTVIQRKCRRTEQSRKLAEARREFQLKFNNGKPDRQRLTMIDLIFYNPATAPMSQKKSSRKFSEMEPEGGGEETIIEDDVQSSEKAAEKEQPAGGSDEENAIPAPQIKIGVNGEIIIDEQSLVIENKETIKSREALKQSEIVDGDFDTSYGVFKKAKRSKDWNKTETLRFYKALNTIGTDFTLMCELFPGRNRRELKMKFKKEERMNRALIDKAVMQPITFDLTELRKEVELAQLEKLQMDKMKEEKEKMKEENGTKEPRKKRKRGSMGTGIQTPNEKDESVQPPRKKRPIRQKKKIHSSQEFIKGGINSLIDSDSDSVSTVLTQSSESLDPDYTDPSSKEENPANLIPGSLMILSEVNEDGETVNNIYTVDENGEKVQVELTPEILDFLTKTAEKNEEELLNNNNNKDNEGCKNGEEMEVNGEDEEGCEKTQLSLNMSVSDSVVNPFLSDLDNSRILIGDNSMIIPFDEFNEAKIDEGDNNLVIDEAK